MVNFFEEGTGGLLVKNFFSFRNRCCSFHIQFVASFFQFNGLPLEDFQFTD